jgi:hypothetical protein
MATKLTAEQRTRKRRVDDLVKRTRTRYVHGIPRRPLPEGIVLVHNHVVPHPMLGMNGFRAWTQGVDDELEVCDCDWAGVATSAGSSTTG